MSLFNKNRNKIRKQQEENKKIREEHSKQFDKSMNAHLETCKIIKKNYPGFNDMSSENALKLYYEIYNRVRNEI